MSKQEIRPALKNPRHEAFAQALARGMSASAAYVEGGYKANRHNAAALAREEHIRTRVTELQEEQLAIHQQATAAAAANKQVTIESLIAEAEAARAKAMSEKGGAAAAVSALTAKAKLAGMWREKVDQHNTGNPVYASSASLWSAPRSRRLRISPTKASTMSRLRKLYPRCPAGIGQWTDAYPPHSNSAGVPSAPGAGAL
jgi:hypothetical protein